MYQRFPLSTRPVGYQVRLPNRLLLILPCGLQQYFIIKWPKWCSKYRITGCPAGPVQGTVGLPQKVSDSHGDWASAYFVHWYQPTHHVKQYHTLPRLWSAVWSPTHLTYFHLSYVPISILTYYPQKHVTTFISIIIKYNTISTRPE